MKEEKKSKKGRLMIFSITFMVCLLVLIMVPQISADITVESGYDSDATLKAAVRFKSFDNGGDREVYLGVPDLGIGSNRVETDYVWSSNHYLEFDYRMRDGTDNLYTTVDVNDPLLTYGMGSLSDLDYIQIDVISRTSGTVSFENVYLTYQTGGESLGTFTSNTEGSKSWMITGEDITTGFSIEGTLVLTGSQPSGEHSKVQISVGTLPPCCPEVWVDDDVLSSWYDYCHVATLQDAIDHVCAYGTVNVYEGTYNPASTVTIDKPVTILGPQAGIDPRPFNSTVRSPGSSSEAIIDGSGSMGTILYIQADDVTIDGLEVVDGTNDLIYSSSPPIQNTVVKNCIIHQSSGDEGVQLKHCTNGLIYRNYIFDVAQDGANFGYSEQCCIRENEITSSDSDNAAIYVYDSTDITIESNYLHATTAANGIMLYHMGGGTDFIINNLIVDNIWTGKGKHDYDDADGNAINLYKEYVSGAIYNVFHNTVANNEGSYYGGTSYQTGHALYVKKSADVNYNVMNNIFADNNGFGIRTWNNPAVFFGYNDFWNNAQGTTDGVPLDTGGNLYQDPAFVGLIDYHIDSSSPCRDAGINVGIPFDIEKNTRDGSPDMGAFEYIVTCLPEIWVDDDAASSWYDFSHVASVQTGVDHVCPYGTVYVYPGFYDEQVVIDKPLTLISTDGASLTTIQKTVNTLIAVNADQVSVDGFTLIGDSASESEHKGIFVSGSYSDIEIKNCDITASAPIWVHWTTLSHTNLLIDSNVLHDGDWGLVLFNIDDSIIRNNEFSGFSDLGIQLSSWGSRPLPDNNLIQSNTFSSIVYHDILLQAENTIVEYNDVAGGGEYGIGVADELMGFTDEFSVQNNMIRNNNIFGHLKEGVATGYHTGIKPGVFHVEDIADMVDAECNWWGDISGPFNTTKNADGLGDGVAGNVEFCPWLDDVYPLGDCIGGIIAHNLNTDEYFCCIQCAIDDPDTNDNPGDRDVIEIYPGTHVEQINVYKSVTLMGAGVGNTVIQSPDSLTDSFTTSNVNYPIVYVHDVDGVIIHNLTVDGAGKGNSNYRFVGIGMYEAGATLKDLEVINVRDTPFSGAQHGTAIFGWSDATGIPHTIHVIDCDVYDYQKNGITLAGSELTILVEDCTVTGTGPTDITAQNGIQVSNGATGVITENTVTGCSYTGGYWAASGILPQFSGGVLEISDNTIMDNQANIYLVACSAVIDGNVIQASSSGVGLSNFYGIIGDPGDPPVIPDAQPMDPGAPPTGRVTYDITVSNNMISGDGVSDASVGVGVYAGLAGDYDIDFSAANNDVEDWYLGFELYEYSPAELISADINYNNIVGNDFGIYNWLTTTFDCECNWYGDPLGPTHIDNPSGSGDSVSDFVDYLPWLNLPFEDPNSMCGAGLCQDIVYVDDDFTSSTPGWYVDHFPTIQIALDRLSADGTAIIADGIYDEDLIIDDDDCDNTGITIKGAYECFPTDEAAVIKGNMLISVSDVTIQYLEFTPTVDAAVTVNDGVSGTVLMCNKFRRDCVADAVGVEALSGAVVDAGLNWWGVPDGPCGGLMLDGTMADGFGVRVVGDVWLEPWVGVHAEIAEPWGTVEIDLGDSLGFDAEGSFAYSFGGCCEAMEIPMQFLWDFGDGMLSSDNVANHVFDQPGTFEVSLMVDCFGIPGLFGNFMYDWAYVTVHVVEPGTPLTVSADGENLGGYEARVGESVQLFGDAFGGSSGYSWSWIFGDNSGKSVEQNPVHTYDSPGVYMVELMVSSGGETASDTAVVEVFDVDELLVDLVDGSGVAGVEMLFAASVSGGSEPYEFEWDFGDGSVSSMDQASHVYTMPGEYSVVVVVTDDAGRTETDTAVILVEEDTSDVELVKISGVSGGLFLSVDISAGDYAVDWSITVDGTVFFGGSDCGELPAQVTQTVKLPLTLGFGKVGVTVTANQISRNFEGFLFGPFFIDLQEI